MGFLSCDILLAACLAVNPHVRANFCGIRIWEVKAQKAVAACEGHAGAIRSLAFSENGYHMASASDDCIKLWDLRKLANFK